MKVILQKDVINLGDAGDIREVSSGYARNYLIPRKIVIPAIGDSIHAAEHQKKLMALRVEKRNKEMKELSEKINALGSVEVPVRMGAKNKIFGSVTSVHIAQALKNAGFVVDKRKVELNDAIRAVGKFPVKIRLAEKIIATISVEVVPDQNFPVEEEVEVAQSPAAKSAETEEGAAGEESPADNSTGE